MKNYFTYIGGFVAIVLIGAGALWGMQEYRYRKSPEYQAMKYFNDLADQYAKDTYGGNTPEETLQLFVDALKKGDVELASRYFIPQKQEEWRNKLKKILNEDKIKFMLEDLSKLKSTKQDNAEAFYTVTDKNKLVLVEMILTRNINNKWKIYEL